MVSVGDAYCVDRYEASRPDATATDSGSDESRATSRAGVLPWETTNASAEAACRAAGKALCTAQQWQCACEGAAKTTYSYGDSYEPKTCNGIDTFCSCDKACSTLPECPFAGCYHQCGADFHLLPTGSMAGCVSPEGAFDLNGNVWEHVRGGSAKTVRGGAFNCGNSLKLHRCDYIPGDWAPSARGFRCCLIPGSP
ncbi:MAG: hypothetical protein CSA65_07830 [Proteobacteria bacterium]|nr:MAG: hypothetical protein CSA65_07830 [Pseudomonadota bacterium]